MRTFHAPLPEEEMLQIERLLRSKSFNSSRCSFLHKCFREDGVVLTQVPQQVFGPHRKSAYQPSPRKIVFGSDGVDNFDDDEVVDEGSSMKARYFIHHVLSKFTFLIFVRVPLVLIPSSDIEDLDADEEKSDFENKNPHFYDL